MRAVRPSTAVRLTLPRDRGGPYTLSRAEWVARPAALTAWQVYRPPSSALTEEMLRWEMTAVSALLYCPTTSLSASPPPRPDTNSRPVNTTCTHQLTLLK